MPSVPPPHVLSKRPSALDALAPPAEQAFSAREVDRQVVQDILDRSARAPSGVNTQPWQVVVLSGPARARLVRELQPQVDALATDAAANAEFWKRFETHRLAAGWHAADVEHAGDAALTAALTAAMRAGASEPSALRHYFDLAGAPVGIFFFLHEQLGVGSVLDCGMFIQNAVLTAQARGLRAVLQTGWRGLAPAAMQSVLRPPASSWLLCALAVGHLEPVQAGTPTGAQADAQARSPGPDMASRIVWHG